MPSQLHFGEFGPVRILGTTLVVLCAYRGGVGARQPRRFVSIRGLARVVSWVTLLGPRLHIAAMRDYYANPRSSAVQVELARAALALGRPTKVRVVVDALLTDGAEAAAGIGEEPVETVAFDRGQMSVAGTDSVVLVYPDALGLGFGDLESRLVAAGARNIAIVTGRRRAFPLTPRVQRALRWRRFLANTRLAELAAAVAILPTALVLAGYDRMRGRE